MSSNVAEMRLTAPTAETRIQKIAQVSANVIFGQHARQQMVKREIFDDDVFRVLRNGNVDQAPQRTKTGEWKCKIVQRIRGTRSIGVITVILHSQKLFIKTVEWEDLP